MDAVLEGVVDDLISDNEDVRSAFDALCQRGVNHQDAKEELARAFMGCLREAWHADRPITVAEMRGLWERTDNRFTDVLRHMRENSTTGS